MNRFFTLVLATSCLTAVGQVPDYMPTEGLVAYFPFDGNVVNLVSDEDGLPTEADFDTDRFGQPSGALAVVSGQTEVLIPLASFAEGGDPRTISYWLKRADNATDGEPFTGVVYNGQSCGQKSFGCGANIYKKGVSVDFSCGALTFDHASSHDECGWNHIAVVVPDIPNPVLQDVVVYENGELLEFLTGTSETSLISTIHGEYAIGGTFYSWGDRLYDAADLTCGVPLIDDLTFYNRALSHEEVNELFSWTPAIGCTDPEACNYDAEAVVDDDSCMDCSLFAERCGPGTAWDDETQMCIIANPSDSNFDGCVQLNDLLDLLSAYGDCGAEESAWQCGDPLAYQGYDYETVQIGEQCWFAENLRSLNYRNDDEIPSGLTAEDWQMANSGASTLIDFDAFGRLYNWYAVDDIRGICPTGWGVPTDEEWKAMEVSLGMAMASTDQTGWRGVDQGNQMKATTGWGNGTNASGFAGLPGGYRGADGVTEGNGTSAYWWSSSPLGANAWIRHLRNDESRIYRNGNDSLASGFSVRCLQDAE